METPNFFFETQTRQTWSKTDLEKYKNMNSMCHEPTWNKSFKCCTNFIQHVRSNNLKIWTEKMV